jgi:dihydrofolate reductase
MPKIISSTIVSLDGFAADAHNDMSFFNVDEKFFDISKMLTDGADTAIYGRKTFEMMDSYWPDAADQPDAGKHEMEHTSWYKQAQKIVISSHKQESRLGNTITISENIKQKIEEIKTQTDKNLVIFGSPSIVDLFTSLDLIDEYWIFIFPILLGSGLPLFKSKNHLNKLQLIDTLKFDNGSIGLNYKALR